METIIASVIVLGSIGIIGAVLLFFAAKKFYVHEDPRIARVEECLPGANCGGCGYSGCHAFASACASAGSLDGLYCPGAGADGMEKIASILGLAAGHTEPRVAVLHCNGSCENRPRRASYDGARSCAILNSIAAGASDCSFGCLGMGDCVDACSFRAIHINPVTGLPVINQDTCSGCGACTRSCPRGLLELRPKGPKGRRVFVACANKERGALAVKECKVSCMGCGKCARACPFEAIAVTENLAYIDPAKCRLCRKCVDQCPTHAIATANFPPRPAILSRETQKDPQPC